MRIENLYPVFRYIASKQLDHLLKKDASNWKRQWSEFFLNDLINFQYEASFFIKRPNCFEAIYRNTG